MPPRTRRGAPPRGGATPAPKSEEPAAESAAMPPPPPPASTSTDPTASTSTSTVATARPAASRSFKLRPKAVRRADDERRALAEQEEKKLLDRVAADDARRRRENRLRGGRGRGRGRGRGDFGGLVRHTAPDGPFSQGTASQRGGRTQGGGGFGGGGGGGLGGGRGAGSGPEFTTTSGPTLEEDPRLNTDMFNGRAIGDYGDEGDDNVAIKDEHAAETMGGLGAGKMKLLQSHLLPMGIKREEHRDREVVVATTAELEAEAAAAAAGGAGVDDADDSGSDMFIYNGDDALAEPAASDDNEVWSRASKAQRSVKLVGPDGQEIEVTEIDTLAEKRAEIAAATAAAAAAAEAESGEQSKKERDEAGTVAGGAAAKQKKRKPQPPKDSEEATIEEGLQVMLRDLAVSAPHQPALTVSSGESGGEGEGGSAGDEQQKEEEKNAEAPRREGRLFLFQFPPVLPTLQAFPPAPGGAQGGSGGAGVVKQELSDQDDVTMLDHVAPHAETAAVDLTGSSEGDDSNKPADDGRKPSDIGEGGFLGELVIRRSGRAELSWGGMTYEMMPGTDVQFLTTAVLLEEAEEKPQQPPQTAASTALTGNAFGMGPVGGKYNLVPVFSDEREWEVDEEELGVLE